MNRIRTWLQDYRAIGVTADMPEYEKRSYYIFNLLLGLTLGITAIYAVVPYFLLHIGHVLLNHALNGTLFLGYLICIFLAKARKPNAARILYTTLVQFHIFAFTLLIGWDIGNYLFYLALPALPYVIFHRSRFGVIYGLTTGLIGFSVSFYLKKISFRIITIPPEIYDGLFLTAFISTFLVIFFVVRLFYRLSRLSEERLNHEKKRSERLLLNILPQDIAARLQQGESTIADHYDPVVVLFADIVGFTEISARTPPGQLVQRLNEVFSLIDILVEKYDLEKIKTIGDAYMVVAGIPRARPDDLARTIEFARETIEMVKASHGIELRVGVDMGEATAGVIGTKKFIFDLWGDTVNTASRMESHGLPGKIHATERVAAQLGPEFARTARGKMIVKGKGEMATFFIG